MTMVRTALKETLDLFPGGLLITDRESRILYASAALERRTGFSLAEAVGKKPGELWGGKMQKSFYASLWDTIGTAGRPFVAEVSNTKKNGAKKDEHIFIVPIRDRFEATRYYAEIHPELSGRVGEVAFGREFLVRAAERIQGRDFFSWVFQTLRMKKDGTVSGPDMVSGLGEVSDASQFLRETFIIPTEKLFTRRHEDAVLVAEAQKNPQAFSVLFEKYVSVVREYFARRLGGNAHLADDMAQEVFIRAFRSLPSFRMGNASYYTFLLRVAHNVLVNHYRSERRRATASLSGLEEADKADEERPSQGWDLEKLLADFSETERTVMLWKYREALKVREIAGRLGKTENAVKLILSRTRKKLRRNFF